MFRKPNRSIRVRKAEFSEEERDDEEPERNLSNRLRLPERRGITCRIKAGGRQGGEIERGPEGSPRNDSGGERGQEEKPLDDRDVEQGRAKKLRAGSDAEGSGGDGPVDTELPRCPGGLLSFTEERDGDEVHFKIRKLTVNPVLFKVQKKADPGDDGSKPEDYEVLSVSSESSESECKKAEDLHSDGEDSSSSSSTSDSSSSSSSSKRASTGEIPDAKTIRAARRQRARARVQGDYIALDASHDASESSQSNSDDELYDHERRISFAPGMKTLREQMKEETLSNSNSGRSENEEDEEFQDRWEEHQIRKAIKYPQVMDDELPVRHRPRRDKRKTGPKFSLPPVAVGDIRKKLNARLTGYQEVHRAHKQDREKFALDLENSRNSLEMLEKSSTECTYKFFKEMKTFVENFVDCMNEKIVEINKLESEMLKLHQHRAQTLLKRRQEELRIESAAVQKLSENEKSNTEVDNAALSLLDDSLLRRNRRQQAREESGKVDHCLGMSSDDEIPDEEERTFQEHGDHILLELKNLFEDVHEDFHQTKNILSRFHKWRKQFPESYYDAYISLCLHKLLNPLVRVQLIDWSPLENTRDLEEMQWYQDLEEFCSSNDNPETNLEDNPDHKVLSSVVEKIVVPKVSVFIEDVWDPLSSVQTNHLVTLCKRHVLENESSKAVQGLVSCVVSRLRKAIEDDVFIPLYAKSASENKTSPQSRFQDRQFWSAVKMLRNIFCWDGFLEDEILQELGLDKLLNRYLLLILLNAQPGSESVKRCNKVVDCLPQSWFRGLESGSSLPRLAHFSKHLLQSAHALHKMNERENMDILVSLLMKIKAFDYAEELIKQYNLEEHKLLKSTFNRKSDPTD